MTLLVQSQTSFGWYTNATYQWYEIIQAIQHWYRLKQAFHNAKITF